MYGALGEKHQDHRGHRHQKNGRGGRDKSHRHTGHRRWGPTKQQRRQSVRLIQQDHSGLSEVLQQFAATDQPHQNKTRVAGGGAQIDGLWNFATFARVFQPLLRRFV